MNNFKSTIAFSIFLGTLTLSTAFSSEIGVYYFPGWASTSSYWGDIKGLSGSRSPGVSWSDRVPLLGIYPEEQGWVAERHIDWASSYGINFFVYDWYWNGRSPDMNHAIDNFLKARNKSKMKFSLLWVVSHFGGPKTLLEFTSMVDYWSDNYFNDSQYLLVDGKPVVIVYAEESLVNNSAKYGKNIKELYDIARNKAISKGLKGIYFVGTTQAIGKFVNGFLVNNGYDAVTGYNYLSKGFKGEYIWNKEPPAANYAELLEGYKSEWDWFIKYSALPYFIPISAGFDNSPWGGSQHCSSNPQDFRQMLLEAKFRIYNNTALTKGIGIVYAWNEFGEGGYIEPTKKWGFQYLQAIKDVFGK